MFWSMNPNNSSQNLKWYQDCFLVIVSVRLDFVVWNKWIAHIPTPTNTISVVSSFNLRKFLLIRRLTADTLSFKLDSQLNWVIRTHGHSRGSSQCADTWWVQRGQRINWKKKRKKKKKLKVQPGGKRPAYTWIIMTYMIVVQVKKYRKWKPLFKKKKQKQNSAKVGLLAKTCT